MVCVLIRVYACAYARVLTPLIVLTNWSSACNNRDNKCEKSREITEGEEKSQKSDREGERSKRERMRKRKYDAKENVRERACLQRSVVSR